LLWLWCRPAATALIGPLAWEPPYAAGAALEKAKRQKKKKKKRNFYLWGRGRKKSWSKTGENPLTLRKEQGYAEGANPRHRNISPA